MTGQPPDLLPPALRITPEDEIRRQRLVRMKTIATLMLVAVAIIFVVARIYETRYPPLSYVRAFAEAAMVGGIADWFAVTALFRRPLGLPIPHTAIVPARKDRIGNALGNFVQRNFLTKEVVAGKIAALNPGKRAATWMSEPENSRKLARHVARAVGAATDVMSDEDVQTLVEENVVARLRKMQAAPLLARLFELLTSGGRHQALLDDALRMAARFVAENDEVIRDRIRAESPWWVPGAVEDRLGDRIVTGVEKTLAAVAEDPSHPLRKRYDDAVQRFVESLRTSPEVIEKAEQLKLDLLSHPGVGQLSHDIWSDVRARIRTYADSISEDSATEMNQMELWFTSAGNRILMDEALTARVDAWIVEFASYATEHARDEVARLIAGTVASWDANATSRKIELQIGRDLQFIRINGTVVGGLVGLLIHALGAAF